MNPILYFDFETTGTDPRRHGIIQAAWIAERNGEVIAERCFDVDPEEADINMRALRVNGFTLDRIVKGIPVARMLTALKCDIREACIGAGKITPCGHNVKFDLDFLAEASHRWKEPIWDLNYGDALDTLAITRWYRYIGRIALENCKLETACGLFDIPIKAHDALEDVRAVRSLLAKLKLLGETNAAGTSS
jgi:DNA polymerase-3 subunit epsilon